MNVPAVIGLNTMILLLLALLQGDFLAAIVLAIVLILCVETA